MNYYNLHPYIESATALSDTYRCNASPVTVSLSGGSERERGCRPWEEICWVGSTLHAQTDTLCSFRKNLSFITA